ncbi:putative papain-like cysteine peptidase DUF1796 [Paenibacillus cellulosilyticus]|uniref:Putative papain-like cysteine peptidase DUF1796 n=1 Tax=Paenibacillus cellulosilyticus TaxID=375489 RepID=A0A2V2Z360_9BACL|nr:DUF1796 family putative cysteine peptidase [Paenibacillus cellulosilyticus]PWW07525.1 putative papain-like cysteine peptidase DUF1796 [Paenibacillus cellulosilyticus]QKS44321.1 peptidase [Paenibacillus cellulosilyticus]
MELHEIAGQYDAIFSLGMNCLPAIQLERNGIRPYTGVLDWVDVVHLPNVTRMIRSRFSNFALQHNLVYQTTLNNFILLRDVANDMIIVHDFPYPRNTPTHWPDYDAFRTKMDRRIARFLTKAASARRILFVRTGGLPEEALELEQALASIVTGEFHVLLVNHNPVSTLVENHWPLPHTCGIMLPDNPDIWRTNDSYWQQLLQNVKYKP